MNSAEIEALKQKELSNGLLSGEEGFVTPPFFTKEATKVIRKFPDSTATAKFYATTDLSPKEDPADGAVVVIANDSTLSTPSGTSQNTAKEVRIDSSCWKNVVSCCDPKSTGKTMKKPGVIEDVDIVCEETAATEQGEFFMEVTELKQNMMTTVYSATKDKEGNVLLITLPKKDEFARDVTYIYSLRPAFEGQEPTETTTSLRDFALGQAAEDEENIPEEKTGEGGDTKASDELGVPEEAPAYVMARVAIYTDYWDNQTRALLSVTVGYDKDNVTGLAWKDLYKGIRLPGFSYKALVVDLKGNVVCKSEEVSSFLVAPGADIFLIMCVIGPFIPDGSKMLQIAMQVAKGLAYVVL